MNHFRTRWAAFITCGAAFAGGGCAAAGQTDGTPPANASGPEAAGPEAQNSSVPGLQVAIEAAFEDAGRRTGLERSKLQLVSAEVVTWRDGSLGCPAPGGNYTQALVPGYRIRIKAGSQELDYHASTRKSLVLCPAGRAVDPIQGEAI